MCINSVRLVGVALALACAPFAHATIQLTLSSGGVNVTVGDAYGAPGSKDSCPDVGCITFVGAIGTWNLNITTGTVGTNPLIDLSSSDKVTGVGMGTRSLTITFSGTGFTEAGGSAISGIGGTLADGQSLTYQAYVDGTNALSARTTPIGSLLSFGPGGVGGTPFSGGTTGKGSAGSPFSLTEVVTLSATIRGTSSFNATVDAIPAVPEPASVLLLGSVLVGVARLMRRRHARQK